MQQLGYAAVHKPNEGVVVVIDRTSYAVPLHAPNYHRLVQALRDFQPIQAIRDLLAA